MALIWTSLESVFSYNQYFQNKDEKTPRIFHIHYNYKFVDNFSSFLFCIPAST